MQHFTPGESPTGRLIRSSPELQQFDFGRARVRMTEADFIICTDLSSLEKRLEGLTQTFVTTKTRPVDPEATIIYDNERTVFDWERTDRYGDQDD